MSRIRTIFEIPVIRYIFILGGALLLYAFLAQPDESIRDFEVASGNGFIAAGPNGLRVVNLDTMGEIGFFLCNKPYQDPELRQYNYQACLNSAKAIALKDNLLFLANGKHGIAALDITNSAFPVLKQFLLINGAAEDIAEFDNYLYVASGRLGLQVIKVNKDAKSADSSTTKLMQYLSGSTVNTKTSIQKVFINDEIVYLADNRRQLIILDIHNREKPKVINSIKFGNDINDIYSEGNLIFLSVGKDGLIVMDATDPAKLKEISRFSTGGDIQSMDKNGVYGIITDRKVGVITLDFTDIQQIRKIDEPLQISGELGKIRQYGEFAYFSNGVEGLLKIQPKVILEAKLEGKSNAPISAEDVAIAGNYAFLAANERGLRILDVSSPNSPQPAGFADTEGNTQAVAVSGGKAFLADGNHGMVIIDATNPTGNLPRMGSIQSKNAVDIAVVDNYAYLADVEEGLKVIDVSTPMTPTVTGALGSVDNISITATGLSVRGDYAYLASGGQGMRIINIHDKSLPAQVQRIEPQNKLNDARAISVQAVTNCSGQPNECDRYNPLINDPYQRIYAYLANGIYGFQIYDVTDPYHYIYSYVGNFTPQNDQGAVEIQAYRERLYLGVRGVGLYIYDITNPILPQPIGFIDFHEESNQITGLAIAGPNLYTTLWINGLRIHDVSNVNQIISIGEYKQPELIKDLAVSENNVYTVDGQLGMWIFDVTDPKKPVEIGFVRTPGQANGLSIHSPYIYIADGNHGLRIFNVANPKLPSYIGTYDTDGTANAVYVQTKAGTDPPIRTAYVADGANGLVVLNVSNPESIVKLGHIGGIGTTFKLTLWRDYVFMLIEENGLVVVSVVDPANPTYVGKILTNEDTRGLTYHENIAYIAIGPSGLSVIDISSPLNLQSELAFAGDWIEDVSYLDLYLFEAVKETGVQVYENPSVSTLWPRGSYVSENSDPEIIKVVPVWNPPADEGSEPGYYRLYVADNKMGFEIVKAVKKSEFVSLGQYIPANNSSFTGVINYVRSWKNPESEYAARASKSIQEVLFQLLILGLGGLFFWAGFMALFILPANRFADWESLFARVVLYMFGKHGPVIRVREGKVIQHPNEETRPGPGLVIVDASSAVVLERRNIWKDKPDSPLPVVRVASAGIVYMGGNVQLSYPKFQEVLRGVADLRPQIRFAIGVNAYTRDEIEVGTTLFTIFTLGELPDVIMVTHVVDGDNENNRAVADNLRIVTVERQTRKVVDRENPVRQLVVRSFSDDIDRADKEEIHDFLESLGLINSPTLNSDNGDFSLESARIAWDRNNRTGGLPFIVDRDRIMRAIYASAVDESEKTELEWTELPTKVTIEVFRDLLSNWMYDDLYRPLQADEFRIQWLKSKLDREVKNQGVLAFQYIRRKDGAGIKEGDILNEDELLSSPVRSLQLPHPEKPKILRDRGIKVKFAGFAELTPADETVRDRLFEYWQARIKKEEDIVLGDLELVAYQQQSAGKLEAQRIIMTKLQSLLNETQGDNTALAVRVLEALESAAADPETRKLLPEDSISMLRDLRNWILH